LAEFLEVGDVIELGEGRRVFAHVPAHFLYVNKRGDFSLAHDEVVIGGELAYLAGTYIVTATEVSGGGHGHGPHDVYSDGYRVFCIRADNKYRVDFYQSGDFKGTILPEEISPIGKATLKWVWDSSSVGREVRPA
jgi:hypothetical protein